MRHTIILLMFFAFNAKAQYTEQSNTVTRTFRWEYDGHIFSSILTFDYNDYLYYRKQSKTQPYSEFATEHNSHPYLLKMAKVLDEEAKRFGYTGYKMVAYLAAFSQQAIPYKSDPYNNGYDFPRYPLETLVDRAGDCEDHAALLVALLKVFKFDAMLVMLPEHVAAAFACTNCEGSYYNKDGRKYYYIETTNKWNLGDMPREYWNKNATLLAVATPTKYFQREKVIVPNLPPPPPIDNNNFFDYDNGRARINGNRISQKIEDAFAEAAESIRINNRTISQIITSNNSSTNTSVVVVNGRTYTVKGGSNVSIIVQGNDVIINTQ